MIEVVDLYKSFKNYEVLRGVNLKVEEGQILALIGGSGKGKSVLLKHIIGLIKPDRGKVLIDNQDISGGMKKRVALASCLVMNPEIILFDEPTTGLDPLT